MLWPPKNEGYAAFAYVVLPGRPIGSRIVVIRRGEPDSVYGPLSGVFTRQGKMGMKKLKRIAQRINAQWKISAEAAGALKADWLMQCRNEPIAPWEYQEYQTGTRVAARGRADDVMLEPAPRGYLTVYAKVNGFPENTSPRLDSIRFWRLVAFREREWLERSGRDASGRLHPRERQALRVLITAYELLDAGSDFWKCSRKAERLAVKCGDHGEAERIRAIPYAERLSAGRELRRGRQSLLLRHLHAIAVYRPYFETE